MIGRLKQVAYQAGRSIWSYATRYENHPRYLMNSKLIAEERDRARSAVNIPLCERLEMSIDQLNPERAAMHLNKLGCLLVRGDDQLRSAVMQYRVFLDRVGYARLQPPCGGPLWFEKESTFQFHMHRLVQNRFYDLCRYYLGSDLLLSSAGTTASIRTVLPTSQGGVVPFHQDVSPVDISRALTFWIAIDPDRIGRDAPGLRFIASIATRRTRVMAHHTDASGLHELAPGLQPDEFFWTPEINAGHVMIFDPYSPHASFSDSKMTLPRTSVDLRVCAFKRRQARAYLASGHGPIIFNKYEMMAPSRIADGLLHFEEPSQNDPDLLYAFKAMMKR
jgi:hypothetical protein